MTYTPPAKEPIRLAGTAAELWIMEHGMGYRLFCVTPGHTCRTRTFTSYTAGQRAALLAGARGHRAALHSRVSRHRGGAAMLEIRLDHHAAVPTADQNAHPEPFRDLWSRRKARTRRAAQT